MKARVFDRQQAAEVDVKPYIKTYPLQGGHRVPNDLKNDRISGTAVRTIA